MPKFVHLHTHSHYSLLDGLSKIDGLVNRTKELGMNAIALTDHGALYGAVEFYKAAKKAEIKPILGVETYVAARDRFSKDPNEKYYHLILLAENNEGWSNLIKLITKAHLEGYYYRPRIDKDLLREYGRGLIATSSCLGGEIDQALLSGNYEKAKTTALEYQNILGKGNYFLEIQKHPNLPISEKIEKDLIKLSADTGIPLVATQDSHYLRPEDSPYHDVLLAVQTGNKVSDDDRLTMKQDDFSVLSPEEMAKKFPDIPEALENTAKIAERCNVELEMNRTLLPDFEKPAGKTADEYLRELVYAGLYKKIPKEKQTKETAERMEYELGIIAKTGFADYFLIVQDLISWAKKHGIAVGPGRGSAAGSLVSYALDITDLDPLRYDLLFERFLNPERIQMPDIDIDFADTRRDEVLSYAREKYGEDRVARIITFGTMAARAAVRDAGRAMGMSYDFCDKVAKLIPFNPTQGMKEGWLDYCLENISDFKDLYQRDVEAKKLIDTAKHLEGVVRHASVHACATVISKETLINYIPLQFAPQDKETIITQFEMHAVEDLGLLKIDLLGLSNLTTIVNTINTIKELHGTDIDISKIPLDDAETFKLFQEGSTTGFFQFESSGMRRYLKELKPTEFDDLIAMVALFRPGPLELIPSFIKRKHGEEKITYLHPKLEPILKSTYGIGVYQEQMMQIARSLAGYTLPEADTLRKAIGKKIKSLLAEQKEKLIKGMLKNGIPQKTAKEIWELFPPFARYGFNKSHAACYALIAYRTAYLKAHYPQEFMASLLNDRTNDIERIAVLVAEAENSGIKILPPDANKSSTNFIPEGKDIRFGLLAIKNVGSQIAESIVKERAERGPFQNFSDFLSRVRHKDLNKKSLESMIKSGVFDSFGLERNQGLQNMEEILKFVNLVRKSGEQSGSLFGNSSTGLSLKLKPTPPAAPVEKLIWEKELLGFYLSDHPLNAYKNKIEKLKAIPISEALKPENKNKPIRVAGIISAIKKIMTKNGQPMLFVKLEDFSQEPLEIIVFNETLGKTISIWKENNVVVIQGKISPRNGESKLICEAAGSFLDQEKKEKEDLNNQ